MEQLTNMQHHKARAEQRAWEDYAASRGPDPARYGARIGSAWETWYLDEYRRLSAD